jgi:hypothetical protein
MTLPVKLDPNRVRVIVISPLFWGWPSSTMHTLLMISIAHRTAPANYFSRYVSVNAAGPAIRFDESSRHVEFVTFPKFIASAPPDLAYAVCE